MQAAPVPDAPERAAVRAALRVTVLQGLRPVSLGLAATFVVAANVAAFAGHGPAGMRTAFAHAAVSLAFDLVFLATALRWARPASANRWALFGALAVLVDVGASLVANQDPTGTVGLVLLQLGASLFLLSWPCLAAILALSDAVWLGVAVPHGFPGAWGQEGFLLAGATALACAAHAVRLRTLGRLELLRLRDQATQASLRSSLAAEEKALAAARASEARLRLVAAATFEGICIHDGVTVRDANPAFAALVGMPVASLVGRPVLGLVEPAHQHAVAQRLLVAAPEPLEAALVDSDGAPVSVELRGAALDTPSGGAYVLAVRDLTHRRLAVQRQAEIDRLREASALKTRFINMASHELRTPLTPITLQVGMLRGPNAPAPLDGRQQRALDIIHRNLERLNRLMGDILDSGRLQADRLRIDRRRIDLEALLRDAVDAARDEAAAKGVTLAAALDPDAWVLADAGRIQQVVANLLGNALKFTPPGGTVEVRARAAGDQVLVEVRDSGLGVRPEDRARLFQPFSQVHDPATVPTQGSGLGLHICKGIVDLHGGAIGCVSEGAGRGANFWFTLPAGGA